MKRGLIFAAALLLAITLPLAAQDFGFDGGDAEGGGSKGLAVEISGEIQASVISFFDDFSDGADHTRLGDIFSGKLKFTAESSFAKGVINLKIAPGLVYYDNQSPVALDEGYVTAYWGQFDVTGGLRKLTWGKADSMGPLDVINPLDYSDLSDLSDPQSLKIARPLVSASWHFGQFSKLEGVFVPNFEPLRFAESGRWAMAQFADFSQLPPGNIIKPDTTTLDYAQAGLRYTTTTGGTADIGAQYYYGRLTTPAVTQTLSATDPLLPIATFAYNPYHQIGVDYAQVISGFNIRAEMAANITEDIAGDDNEVYNPSLAWSFGFDRDLVWGVNLNLQCNETIRLLDNKISAHNDIEADSDITSTLITAILSKSFLHDELELKAAALWEVESGACIIMPSLAWTKNDVEIKLSAGIFAGKEEGLFGQFHSNSFIKAGIKYTF